MKIINKPCSELLVLAYQGFLARYDMKKLKKLDSAVTMSSLEIVKIINDAREDGRAELAHSDFMKKVVKVLGEDAGKFSSIYKDSMNRDKPCYSLPKRETHLMVMSESYKVQAIVYDRMVELEKENTLLREKTNNRVELRASTKAEYRCMSKSLQTTRLEQGKETKHFHFSNEAKMLNRIVIGMTSKQYRIEHELDKDEPIRNHFTSGQLQAIDALEATNTALINLGESFETRKEKLNEFFDRRFNKLLIEECYQIEG